MSALTAEQRATLEEIFAKYREPKAKPKPARPEPEKAKLVYSGGRVVAEAEVRVSPADPNAKGADAAGVVRYGPHLLQGVIPIGNSANLSSILSILSILSTKENNKIE